LSGQGGKCEDNAGKGYKMKPKKHGKKWQVVYRVPGYSKTISEYFDTEAEAKLRCAEVELYRMQGTLCPPSEGRKAGPRTVADLLDEYVTVYGTAHWGDSYYSYTVHRIEDYIKPAIGDLPLRDLTPQKLDLLYSSMLNTPAVVLPGHRDKTKTISYPVVEKCHCVLRSALNQAVRWGYIPTNPALAAKMPKAPSKRREVWTPADAQTAISVCEDLNLKASMLLAVGCSLRLGEILGLQWKQVHISEESIQDNSSELEVRQELKRCNKDALEALDSKKRGTVFFTFPETKGGCKTSLVLKVPKTESSIRTVYIPNSVAKALQAVKAEQEKQKEKLHGLYQDFDMVIAQPDGRPTEERLLAKDFKKLIRENDLPPVVFHSLRHLSTSMKLKYSGGDIKAVQGDTGHSQASMVTQVYSHTFDENRRRVANIMENSFFNPAKKEQPPGKEKSEQLLSLLAKSPELTDVLLALAEKLGGAVTS
jgi:integrase